MTKAELRPLDADTVPALRDLAIAQAVPNEVMPPVDGPGEDWTAERIAAFTDFQHARLAEPDHLSYVITVDGAPAGVVRLDRDGETGRQIGYWVARSHRRKGLATEAVRLVLIEAKALGATTVTAETTTGNHGSRAALARNGAELSVDGDDIRAVFPL
ncbi:GNAT family N-acetyltransferase [Phytomonospora sp. NPDC050363]|uniref:GNAT family N-acetyltransferase n=1 Tax=Phytomonospora sp. NPDC050363 TaxID=3155642 RepID=UPI0033CF550C